MYPAQALMAADWEGNPMRMEPRGLRQVGAALVWVPARMVMISLVLAAAASAEPTFDRAHGRCEIEFFATSTKRDFSGSADARSFLLTRHAGARGGPGWWSASVEVAVTDLLTGYDERDGDMHWMFDANHFPSIFAEFPHIASEAYEGEHIDGAAPLEFHLTIREEDLARLPTAKQLARLARSGQ